MSTIDGEVSVLVVDDDPEVAQLVATQLEMRYDRFDIETVHRGVVAVDRVTNRDWDCLVTDHNMPGLTGVELADRVSDRDPSLPIVLFTRADRRDVLDEALDAGISDYLRKRTHPSQYRLLAKRIIHLVAADGPIVDADLSNS